MSTPATSLSIIFPHQSLESNVVRLIALSKLAGFVDGNLHTFSTSSGSLTTRRDHLRGSQILATSSP